MQMSHFEAAQWWRGYKKHDIASLRILAELNNVRIEEMRMFLLEAGVRPVELPRAERKKKGKSEMTEENVKTDVKTEEKCEAEPEYHFPPAPKYPDELPKVWRLEELEAILNSVFVALCEKQSRACELTAIDEIRGMYGLSAYCEFRNKVLAALKQNAPLQLRTEE